MQCPKCGHNNPSEGTKDGHCDECGYLLFSVDGDLASLDERFLAHLIDLFIYIGILSLSIFVSLSFFRIGFFLAILAILYLLFSDAFKGGQSIGKRLMEIQVVDATSRKPCTAFKSLIRNLSLTFLGMFDWGFIFSEKRQRLGDKLANTIVIKKRYMVRN
jgi:uncharacterized RDD family membrane protein YckC